MKRVAIGAVTVALVLSGCGVGPPAGTDGNLTNAWPAMPAAHVVVPVAGVCYGHLTGDVAYTPLVTIAFGGKVVDCRSADHDLETVSVGAFTGPEAAAATPPDGGAPVIRAAYATCDANAAQYLGGDWRTALVWVSLIIPPIGQWRVGARWFRCDLGHMASPVNNFGLIYAGSVKDGLRGSRPLAITCVATVETSTGRIVRADPVGCNAPHQAEFAGIYVAPDGPWPAADDGEAVATSGCLKTVGRFLGFGYSADWYSGTVGYWATSFDKARWEIGDRSVRCFAYAYTKNKTFVGSVQGIRGAPARSG